MIQIINFQIIKYLILWPFKISAGQIMLILHIFYIFFFLSIFISLPVTQEMIISTAQKSCDKTITKNMFIIIFGVRLLNQTKILLEINCQMCFDYWAIVKSAYFCL